MDSLNRNTRETAELLGVSEATVKRLIRRGELLSINIGGRRLVPQTAIDEYQASLVNDAREEHDAHLEQQQRINQFTRKRRPA